MNMITSVLSADTSKSADIIDVIRSRRNDLIKDFLDERNLITYLSGQYRVMDLSTLKVRFIKADLKRMLTAPVDAEWYKPIIEEYNNTRNVVFSEGYDRLFYKEIDRVLKKYIY